MKKLLLLFIVLSMASCIAPYHTKHQARTMRNISKPRYGSSNGGPFHINHSTSPRKRGDYNHPAVRKQTRKSLQQNGNQYYTSNSNFSTLGTWYRPHEK